MAEPLVSIGIVGWNSVEHLPACISSLKQQTYKHFEVLFFDNASSDASIELIRRLMPEMCIIESPRNIGFGSAHNAIILQIKGAFYLPLNPDVVLDPRYIEAMVKTFGEMPAEVGSANGKVLFSPQGSNKDLIFSKGQLLVRDRRFENIGYKVVNSETAEEPCYIFGPNGCCPFLRASMIKSVSIDGHFFDPLFFLYQEDYDVNWRAQHFGWKSIYVPEAMAYHAACASGGLQNPVALEQYQKNRYLAMVKNDQLSHFILDLPHILLAEIVYNLSMYLLRPRRWGIFLTWVTSFLMNIPYALRARKKIKLRKKVSSRYMRGLFDPNPWGRYAVVLKRLFPQKGERC